MERNTFIGCALVILLLAAGVRMAYFHSFNGMQISSDGTAYLQSAENISRGSFQLFSRRPLQQLYSTALSPAFFFGIPVLPYAAALNILFSVISVFFSMLIARTLGSEREALAAGLCIAFSPNLIFWASYVLTEMLFLALLGFFVWTHLQMSRSIDLRHFALYLIAAIVLMAARPVAPAAIFTSVGFLIAERYAKRRGLSFSTSAVKVFGGMAFLFSFLTGIFLLNTTVREKVLAHENISGMLPYTIRMADNDMENFMTTHREMQLAASRIYASVDIQLAPQEISRQALKHIGSHPLSFAGMVLKRFVAFWHPWIFGRQLSSAHRVYEIALSILLSGVLLVLLFKNYPLKSTYIVLPGMALAFSLLHALLQIDTDNRYRLPSEYLLLTLLPATVSIVRGSLWRR